MYAYETDGLGNHLLMDDANIPSLLSIPYIGYVSTKHDPGCVISNNTRRFILSSENPYYYSGLAARGIGSDHTDPQYIWHLSLIAQGLTSNSSSEVSSANSRRERKDRRNEERVIISGCCVVLLLCRVLTRGCLDTNYLFSL